MALTVVRFVVVMVLCLCGDAFVYASSKLDTDVKVGPNVNYILPQPGFEIEVNQPTSASSHKDLSVS